MISEIFVYSFVAALLLAQSLKALKCMYIEKDAFEQWMEKLFGKMTAMDNRLQAFVNTKDVFEPDDRLFDNQDLCLMLHVSNRTLQRYRTAGILPFLKRGQKIYYKASDVHEFVYSKRQLLEEENK
jgi:hypothetical protein